ncbi:MAG: hypothetical protein Q7U94_02470 [Sideroxyarcus sp.]|nr:hypothetical protein [Sideroxyarcus sp.]
MATSLNKFAAAAALTCVCTTLQAEVLPDPTRPATEFLPSSGAAGSAQQAPADDGLRTILISPDRRSAVINGQQVPLGGKVGGERLMAVCEDSVVLQGADGRHEVSLYPGVVIEGRRNKHCVTPAAKQSTEAAPAPKKTLKKIGHATSTGAANKKEKSCK